MALLGQGGRDRLPELFSVQVLADDDALAVEQVRRWLPRRPQFGPVVAAVGPEMGSTTSPVRDQTNGVMS